MEAKTYFITKDKLEELKREYQELVDIERNKSTSDEAPKMFESEDINPEFISFHEDMDYLKSRIAEVKHILENYELIKAPPKEQQSLVSLGARIKIEVDGEKDEFIIVGTLEANPALGKISNESPVGKALLGHKVGDEVIVSSPIKTVYRIKGIRYEIN